MQRLLPPLLLVIIWVAMIGLAFVLPLNENFPLLLQWFGGLASIVGILIAFFGAKTFRRIGTNIKTFDMPQMLVTTGLFAWSRNPMYLGFAICVLGGALALGSIAALVIAIVFCSILDRWYVQFEEAVMLKVFGEDYRAYCAKVRRWL